MRYSVFAGGKRMRPIMVLMTAEMLDQSCSSVAFAAAALEMIHTYSLIHDDLPAMDDDDLRRGKPTNHKVYGEAMAILAGDALLTMAFQIMTDPKHSSSYTPSTIIAATNELATAAGPLGMVGGQVLDIQAEGRQISLAELEHIHILKTARMITVALRIGAILSHATPQQLEKVTVYGENVGLAFQIVDDILDVEGNAAELGKNPEGDLHKEKATYATLYGLETSKVFVQKLINTAKQSLHLFQERAYYFNQLADFIRLRTH
jgi:geranylgeranyl diphosphate synthase type II